LAYDKNAPVYRVSGRPYVEEMDQQFALKVDFHPMEEVRRQVVEALTSDTNQKVRRALIEMGWTPPPG
jgi:hypothetical protein